MVNLTYFKIQLAPITADKSDKSDIDHASSPLSATRPCNSDDSLSRNSPDTTPNGDGHMGRHSLERYTDCEAPVWGT